MSAPCAKIFYGLKPDDKPRYGDFVYVSDGGSFFWPSYACVENKDALHALVVPRALVCSVPGRRHYFADLMAAFHADRLRRFRYVVFELDPDDPLLFGPTPGPTGTHWWQQIDLLLPHHGQPRMIIYFDEKRSLNTPATSDSLRNALEQYASDMRVCYTMYIDWPAGAVRATENRVWQTARPAYFCRMHGGAMKRVCTFSMALYGILGVRPLVEPNSVYLCRRYTRLRIEARHRATVAQLARFYGGAVALSAPDRQVDGSWLSDAPARVPYAAALVVEFVLATLPFALPVFPIVWLLERLPEMRKFTQYELMRLVDAVVGSARRVYERRVGPVALRVRRPRVSERRPAILKSAPTLAH
jgi:hypothetical protein